METKDLINTMQQSLAEKAAEAPTDTLTNSLAEVKAQKVGETQTNLKAASTVLTLFPTLAVMKPAHRLAHPA